MGGWIFEPSKEHELGKTIDVLYPGDFRIAAGKLAAVYDDITTPICLKCRCGKKRVYIVITPRFDPALAFVSVAEDLAPLIVKRFAEYISSLENTKDITYKTDKLAGGIKGGKTFTEMKKK